LIHGSFSAIEQRGGIIKAVAGSRRADAGPCTAGNSRPGLWWRYGRSPGSRVVVGSGGLPGGSTHQWLAFGLPTRRLQLRVQLRNWIASIRTGFPRSPRCCVFRAP